MADLCGIVWDPVGEGVSRVFLFVFLLVFLESWWGEKVVMTHFAKSESLFEGPLQVSSQWFGRQSYLRFRSGLVFDNDSYDFGVCGGGFARALCIGSCWKMARYIYSCLPLRTVSIFVVFWGFMSKFQKELVEVDFLRFHPTTVRANIVIALMCINKSNAARFEMNN